VCINVQDEISASTEFFSLRQLKVSAGYAGKHAANRRRTSARRMTPGMGHGRAGMASRKPLANAVAFRWMFVGSLGQAQLMGANIPENSLVATETFLN
jgi:hypothetical protein